LQISGQIFNSFDSSKDGFISKQEFEEGLSKLPNSRLKLLNGSWKTAFDCADI
jgi:hypothetical protein